MPYVADGPDGPRWVAKNGAIFGLVGGVGASGTKYVPGKQLRVDKWRRPGCTTTGKKGIRRPGDPHLRIKEMDRDGVDAEVIYGILAAAAKLNDREASNEMLRIYNTWLAEFCSHYPDRHIGLACLPVRRHRCGGRRGASRRQAGLQRHRAVVLVGHGADVASAAGSRCGRRSTRSASRSTSTPSRRCRRRSASKYSGLTLRALMYSSLCMFQMKLANILTALMGRAVFERYPNLRIVFGESGIGWIPYVLDRMDFEFEDQYKDLPLKLKPSEYWRRQCKATFQFDRVGTKLIDEMGVETLMWGSDYPHPDGVWPESEKYIDEQFSHLPADVTRKMTCENARKFYGLVG